MSEKMRGVTLFADWNPRPDFVLGTKDIEGVKTYQGNKVWKNPKLDIVEHDIPRIGPDEVLIEVKACGLCGTDVHMAQADEDGYILFPGLTGFPAILGHEMSGIVVEAGKNTIDRWTNKPYRGGEYVCVEEMLWCGKCKPCSEGYPNQCERLEELGLNINGGFAKYVKVPDNVVWNLEPLKKVYKGNDIFLAGSLVEPTCVAYNAVIEIGGGIRPGDNVVICGGGPVGLAACAILKRNGAARVILSEPAEDRAELGRKMGADYIINPLKEDFTSSVLEITEGMGAKLYVEASGLPATVYPGIEQTIWRGRTINSTVVLVAMVGEKLPVSGVVLQIRRAKIVGGQGHSGHSNFPRVIECMGDGMDMTPLITKKISLDEVPANIISLQTDKKECKITCVL